MAKREVRASKMDLNLTSMMDVTFQLILFFLLINNMSAAELPKLEPPKPIESQARTPEERKRVVINVIPEGTTGDVRNLRVGITTINPGDYGQLTALLNTEKQVAEDVEVDLRADFNVHYSNIQPVMQAITAAGIGRVNLVAQTKDD